MSDNQQPSTSKQPSEASISRDTDGRSSRVWVNTAQQSIFAGTVNNEKNMSFVTHSTGRGSDQKTSAENINIGGNLKYESNSHFYGSDDSAVRDWLLSFSTFDFEAKQYRNFEIAMKAPGTGGWLLKSQVFIDWKDGKVKRLWCYGIPGAGKTILASIIINHLQTGYAFNNNITCIYIYFDHMDQKKHDLSGLLSSLLAQLVRNRDLVSKKVKTMHQTLRSNGICPSSRDLLLMLKSQMKEFPQVFIVIDALDECLNDTTSTEKNTMDKLLSALHELPSNVHVLCTSREDISIEQKVNADGKLEIVARDADLRMYFESQINSFEPLKKLVGKGVKRDEAFLEYVLGTVVAKSQGMFLLAQLHMKSLAAKERLWDFKTGILSLPQTPDEVYKTALDRINCQHKTKRDLAVNALVWLVFAERPLEITELIGALTIQASDNGLRDGGFDAEDLISTCAGIVIVDKHTGAVHLAHYTAEQYLRRENKLSIFQDAHSKIAKTCITYLLLEEFREIPRSMKEVEDRCKKYPFLTYAADHWGNHVAAGVKGSVYKLAWEFLSNGPKLNASIKIMAHFRYRNEEDVSALHMAAYFGLENVLKKAIGLEKSFKLNARTQRRETALHWAALYRQGSFIKLLIDEGADLNVTDIEGRTALHRAIFNGDISSVGLLLSSPRRIDLKLEDSQGWTPLRWAAAYGDINIVEMLLSSGAEIDAQDKDRWTALRWAVQQGREGIVELLIRKQASLETSNGDDKWTLLRQAAQEGRNRLIQLLIRKKVDLNAVDKDGFTAMRWATVYGHGMTAWALIQARADINKPDSKGFTPLHSAAERWQESADKSLIWFLLQNKAEVDAQTNSGLTALHIASSRGYSSVVWLLLEKGANPNQKDNKGFTPLHSVVEILQELGDKSILWVLLENKANINAQSKHGLTALHIASSRGHSSIVRLLLEKGAIPSQTDNNGRTALHYAVVEGHQAVTRVLVEEASSLMHVTDDEKQTALHVTASSGDVPIVSLLLDSGAEIDVRDREGYTPLHRAVSQQHENIVSCLLRRGANTKIPNKKWLTVMQSAEIADNGRIMEMLEQLD